MAWIRAAGPGRATAMTTTQAMTAVPAMAWGQMAAAQTAARSQIATALAARSQVAAAQAADRSRIAAIAAPAEPGAGRPCPR